jgi:hypothetical protein
MTSELWVVGGTTADKERIGAQFRRLVEPLGPGHVEALAEMRNGRFVVTSAEASPQTSEAYGLDGLRKRIRARMTRP